MAEYPLPRGVAERSLVLRTVGLAIPAAFTTPTARPATAALLLIPGSLFCDVNGDFPSWNSYPGTNAYLAHQLAGRGIAVLRYAKAGPGTGSVVEDQGQWDRHRTWDGRVTIARAALTLLRTVLEEGGLDLPMIVSGHSEGAVVASRLVAEHPGEARAAGLVLLAGPAVGILGVMRERIEREAPADQREARLEAMDTVIAAIRAGQAIPERYRNPKEPYGVGGLAMMPAEGLKYLADSDATDPCATLADVGVPVLIVQGSDDANVTVHDAERLHAARAARPSTLLVLDGLSHMFKRVPAGTDPMATFGWPGPCDERVADGVVRWYR
jgi:alpha-beta hydrolase superfamily lysophospholipase